MKSKICFFLLLAISSVIAEETAAQPETPHKIKQQYGYLSLGLGPLPMPLPAFAGGYRARSGHHGVDLSLQVEDLVLITQLKANLLYLHYFKPDFCSEFYVGGGVGSGVLFGNYSWIVRHTNELLSPELVFGKQYRNASDDLRFFQIQLGFTTTIVSGRYCDIEVSNFPVVILSYGIGF